MRGPGVVVGSKVKIINQLLLDMARASKFPLPLSSTAHQMFMQASTAGFAAEDDSAVIKIFSGITLPRKSDVTDLDSSGIRSS
jgi:hypothetical protein